MANVEATLSMKFNDQVTQASNAMVNNLTNNFKKLEKSGSGVADALNSIKSVALSIISIDFAKNFIMGAVAINRAETALASATAGFEDFNEAQKFLLDTSNKLGLVYTDQVKGYAQLAASARIAGVSLADVKNIYLGIAEAGTALQMSQDDMYGSLRAIVQMMSKGKVQAEELRGQLGERLPGAAQLAAKALNITDVELSKLLETGKIYAKDFLPLFGTALRANYGKAAMEASNSAQAAINRLINAFQQLQKQVMMGEGFERFKSLLNSVTSLMKNIGVIDAFKKVAGTIMLALEAVILLVDILGRFGLIFPIIMSVAVQKLHAYTVEMIAANKQTALLLAAQKQTTYFQNIGTRQKDMAKVALEAQLMANAANAGRATTAVYSHGGTALGQNTKFTPMVGATSREMVEKAKALLGVESTIASVVKQTTLWAMGLGIVSKAFGGIKSLILGIGGILKNALGFFGGWVGVALIIAFAFGEWFIKLKPVQKALDDIWETLKEGYDVVENIGIMIAEFLSGAWKVVEATARVAWVGIKSAALGVLLAIGLGIAKVNIMWESSIFGSKEGLAKQEAARDMMLGWVADLSQEIDDANTNLTETIRLFTVLGTVNAALSKIGSKGKLPYDHDRSKISGDQEKRDEESLADRLFEEKQLAEKIKAFEQFAKTIKKLQYDLDTDIGRESRTSTEQEIRAINQKYDEIYDNIKENMVSVKELEKARDAELANISSPIQRKSVMDEYAKTIALAKGTSALLKKVDDTRASEIAQVHKKYVEEYIKGEKGLMQEIMVLKGEELEALRISNQMEIDELLKKYKKEDLIVQMAYEKQAILNKRKFEDMENNILAIRAATISAQAEMVSPRDYKKKAGMDAQAAQQALDIEYQEKRRATQDMAALDEWYAAKTQVINYNKAQASRDALAKWADEYKTIMDMVAEWTVAAAESFSTNFVDGLWEAVEGTKSLKEAFREYAYDFFKQMSKMIMQQTILNTLQRAMSSQSGGSGWGGMLMSLVGSMGSSAAGSYTSGQGYTATPRAGGGPVKAGGSYLVGEKGPEYFSPTDNGFISPNNSMRGYAASQITMNTVVNVNGGSSNASKEDQRKQGQMIADMIDAKVGDRLIQEQRKNGLLARRSIK